MTDLHAPVSDFSRLAVIREGALILSFDQAERPFVARFDLDSLAQASFEIEQKDGYYHLILKDFTDQRLNITHFMTKADAHTALQAILQALVNYEQATSRVAGRTNHHFGKKLLRGIAWLIILATVLVALLYTWAFLDLHFNSALSPATVAQEEPAAEPADPVQSPAQKENTAPVNPLAVDDLPSGEPTDLETLFNPAPSAPFEVPNAPTTE